MSNKKYDNIYIPANIDTAIDSGIQRGLLERESKRKNKKLGKIVAAGLVIVLTIGVANPTLASKIPLVGKVFETIEKDLYFSGNYSKYAYGVNETITSNGIGITVSEVLSDGQSLYISYVVKSEEPFKYTSKNSGKKLDMNQLLVNEEYNKVDFTDEKLDMWSFVGLEGKFIDENTFIGVQKYMLNNLEAEIPNEFKFQSRIIALQNYSVNKDDKINTREGVWDFNIKVKVNKDLKKDIVLDELENEVIKINKISITPFDLVVDTSYKEGVWTDYLTIIYDEDGKELNSTQGEVIEDGRVADMTYRLSNKENKYLKIVVFKHIKEDSNLKKKVVFEKTISLEK